MLMLTHTWVLRELLRRSGRDPASPDIFVYNVAPDLLTIHPSITSAMTHAVPRLAVLPPRDARGAYVQFHLLVDDMAHFGRIVPDAPGEFDAAAAGYAYRQGRTLVPGLTALHNRIGRPISPDEALYRSHIMAEMAFDLNLYHRQDGDLLDRFLEALEFSAEGGRADFAGTLSRLTGIGEAVLAEAVVMGRNTYDRRRMEEFLTVEGRTALFMNKFGVERDDRDAREGVGALMRRALETTEDRNGFLEPVLTAILEAGFRLPP